MSVMSASGSFDAIYKVTENRQSFVYPNGPPWPSGLRHRSSSQDYWPLIANVVGLSPLAPKSLCGKVSSYLRKDVGSTQSELF